MEKRYICKNNPILQKAWKRKYQILGKIGS